MMTKLEVTYIRYIGDGLGLLHYYYHANVEILLYYANIMTSASVHGYGYLWL